MCGRYTLTTRKHDLAAELDLDAGAVLDFEPRYNIAPTQDAAVVRQRREGGKRLDLLRWGLLPGSMPDPPGIWMSVITTSKSSFSRWSRAESTSPAVSTS